MNDKIIVIPLKPDPETKEIIYLMGEKPLYASGSTQLEFPSGRVGAKELFESAARRIFLQETGYDPTWTKFLYAFFPDPQNSDSKVSVYLGLATGESESAHAIAELDGDMILKKIRENDIIDGTSLAAFSAVLLLGNEAKKYLIQELTATTSVEESNSEEQIDEEV